MTKSSVVKAAVSHGYRALKEVDGGEAKQKNTSECLNTSRVCLRFYRLNLRHKQQLE